MQVVDRNGIVYGVDRIQINGPDGRQKPSSINYGLFSQTTNSVPITNTTEEQSLIYVNFERRVYNDGGITESLSCMDPSLRYYGSVGGLSVPSNSFRVGDSFHVTLSGYISSINNERLDIRVKANGGSTSLATTSIVLATSTSKNFDITITFTIRSIGSSGVAKIATSGQFTYSKDASSAFEGSDFISINDTTFDTTIENMLDITAQWATASPLNVIYSEVFILNKIF